MRILIRTLLTRLYPESGRPIKADPRIAYAILGDASILRLKGWIETQVAEPNARMKPPTTVIQRKASRWVTNRLGVKPNTWLLLLAVLSMTVATLQTGCKSSPIVSGSAATPQSPETLMQSGPPPRNSRSSRLECPIFGSRIVPSAQSKGGHRVILSWKPSAPANAKHGAAVGYCVYRRTERNAAETERVNVRPFPGTKCTDDLVENGKKYYYVVRAISATGATSIVSKSVPASIPTSPRRDSDVAGDSAPGCREPASTK